VGNDVAFAGRHQGAKIGLLRALFRASTPGEISPRFRGGRGADALLVPVNDPAEKDVYASYILQ